MSMAKTGIIKVFIFLAAMIMALPLWAEEKKEKQENAAKVNETFITQQDLDQEMQPVIQRMSMQGQAPDEARIAEIKKKVLDNMIDRELLYQDSNKKGLKADEKKVEEEFDNFKKRFPDEKQFADALEKMGISEKSIKKQIREQLTIQQLIETHISKDIKISDDDTKAYYDTNPQYFKQPEQVKASHILIKVDPGADDNVKAEARKKIEDIQKKLKQGGDFAALASELSECPSSKNGGDLGFFGKGQMVKAFEDAVFNAKPGEITDIVETQFGYHIIVVTDKKPESTTPYAEAKTKLEDVLKQEKVRESIGAYLEKLKKDSKIEIFI